MSLIVIFCRTWGRGSGAGKTVSSVKPGRTGVEKIILGDSPLRYEVKKLESEGNESFASASAWPWT